MAKLKFTTLVYDVRGKMGGSIFKRHPYSDQTVLEPARKKRPVPASAETAQRQQDRFTVADMFWQTMTLSEKNEWRAAVKKNHLTGYQLWMKECLGLFAQGHAGPDHPSISGGFSYAKAVPGIKYPNPAPVTCWPKHVVNSLGVRFKSKTLWGEWVYIDLSAASASQFSYFDPASALICFPTYWYQNKCEDFMNQGPRIWYSPFNDRWISMPFVGPGPHFTWEWYVNASDHQKGCFIQTHSPPGEAKSGFSKERSYRIGSPFECGDFS